MDNLEFIIPGKPEYLTMVRLAIGSIAATAGFNLDAVEDIKTAVSEGCKLISCHGFEGFSNKYEIMCNVEKGKLEITIEDRCEGHNLKKLEKPCRSCPAEGDLGVFVIQSLMNAVEIGRKEDGQKSIRMVKIA